MQAQISDTDMELEGTTVTQLVYWQLNLSTEHHFIHDEHPILHFNIQNSHSYYFAIW